MTMAIFHKLGGAAAVLIALTPNASHLVAQTPPAHAYRTDDDFGYGASLSARAKAGRDTWYFWTAGNEAFWVEIARVTGGEVNLLTYVDSRRHGRRFAELGAITQPGCEKATAPDLYGLWLDRCVEPAHSDIPGEPTGIVGLRKLANPKFDPSRWSAPDAETYASRPRAIEPPYRIGMTCAFCHVGFNPLNPPADPELPRWANLHGTIGNQHLREGKLFNLNMANDDLRWHLAEQQPPGTSDTSRFATDHTSNPSAINAILSLDARPLHEERMRDGSVRMVPHILKDGADSAGLALAALRVYANIGTCADYLMTVHDPVAGVSRRQKPFDVARARATCPAWTATEARLPDVEAFLRTATTVPLREAPGGSSYLTAPPATINLGARVFAENCASCHSSKQPPAGTADAAAWYRDAVSRDDFLDRNFLSDDRRYPVTRIGTNAARALATNATRGAIWDQFSSETYKSLPPIPALTGLHNPLQPDKPITIKAASGGRGYYRTPSLVGMWATAPYLHNNALGAYVKDPSTAGRVAAFQDAVEKLLWPERRPGARAIPVTPVETYVTVPRTTRRIRIPAGTPIDYVASVNPNGLPAIVRKSFLLNFFSDEGLFRRMLPNNTAPDFVLDRGHTFGAGLTDAEKQALVEFLKTF